MRIRDCMTEHPHSIRVDEKLSTAAKMMQTLNIRHLPVLKGGHLVGMLTQRDMYFVETFGEDIDALSVEDAMSPDVYSVPGDASLNSVAQHMFDERLGSAVVMDGDKVTGIFTVTDALRILSSH